MSDSVGSGAVTHRRWNLAVGCLAAGAVVAGLTAFAWRWHTDRSYIGTESPANLSWTCWNGIRWTDESSGVSWWAGHDPVFSGQLETQPRASDSQGVAGERSSSGTIRFASYDRAVFTSAAGGTLLLVRPPPDIGYTKDCALGPDSDPYGPSPSDDRTTGIAGTVTIVDESRSASPPPARGLVLVRSGANTIVGHYSNADGGFEFYVPAGTYTIGLPTGTSPCSNTPPVTVTVTQGHIGHFDIACRVP